MLTSITRIAVLVFSAVFALIVIGASADARSKKRGYRVTAGKAPVKKFKRQTFRSETTRRSHRGKKHGNRGRKYGRHRRHERRGDGRRYGGYGKRVYGRSHANHRRYRNRGMRVIAGRDFARWQAFQIFNDDYSRGFEQVEPSELLPSGTQPLILKVTEQQKALGRKRAALRGGLGYKPGRLEVLSSDNENAEEDDFGNAPVVYFND